MINQLLHTPDGVRDIYSVECEKKRILENKFIDKLKTYGYHPIQTPTFEFFDVFSKEIGTIPSKNLYKFFDKDGNTMVLRPDFTPSMARCASKYFMEESTPIRFCYTGSRFVNSSSYRGNLKESTQCGAEFIGDDTVFADAEVLSLTVKLLQTAGLKDFQVSVGNAQFLQGLFEASDFDSDTKEEIITLLQNRNFFGVEDLISEKGLDKDLEYLFSLFKDVMMTKAKIVAALDKAKKYPSVYNALKRLADLEDLLRMYKVEKHVFYELGLIQNFEYYTGIIFAGYTFGSGEAIVTGGRYDNLLKSFGKNAPAIGFAVIVDQLMNALDRQNIEVPFDSNLKWIVYDRSAHSAAIVAADSLRNQGYNVEMMPLSELNTVEVYKQLAVRENVKDVIVIN